MMCLAHNKACVKKGETSEMEAKEKALTFLREQFLYIIPYFQRGYVWNEDNWEGIWQELIADREDCFLGSIILKKEKYPGKAEECKTVIDCGGSPILQHRDQAAAADGGGAPRRLCHFPWKQISDHPGTVRRIPVQDLCHLISFLCQKVVDFLRLQSK